MRVNVHVSCMFVCHSLMTKRGNRLMWYFYCDKVSYFHVKIKLMHRISIDVVYSINIDEDLEIDISMLLHIIIRTSTNHCTYEY